jgi:hypothetical protein
MTNYAIAVWETSLSLNLKRESIVEACETDAPTCVQVFELQAGIDGPTANPHRSPECRLCDMIESYAAEKWKPNTVTYHGD